MKNFSHSQYSLTLPDHWLAENESDYILIYQPDGVGDLIISCFEYEHDISEEDLMEFAAEHLDNEADADIVDIGDFTGLNFCYDTGDEYLCEWYLRADNVMLFITYSCSLEDEEQSEEDIVEIILASLKRK